MESRVLKVSFFALAGLGIAKTTGSLFDLKFCGPECAENWILEPRPAYFPSSMSRCPPRSTQMPYSRIAAAIAGLMFSRMVENICRARVR